MKINPIHPFSIQINQNNGCISDFLAAIKRLAAKIFAIFSCSKKVQPPIATPTLAPPAIVPPNIAIVVQPVLPAQAEPLAAAAPPPPAISWAQKLAHEYPVNLSDLRRITTASDDHFQDEPYEVGVCPQLQGIENLPQLGQYGRNDYPRAGIEFAIRLPKDRLQAFPEGISRQFQNNQNLELYFIIYNETILRAFAEGPRRNILFHTIAYPNILPELQNFADARGQNRRVWAIQNGEAVHPTDALLQMGIFQAEGLIVDPRADRLHAMAFDRMTPQRVYLHNDPMQISPNSARFVIEDQNHVNTFFAASQLPNGRAVAYLGMIVPDENTMNAIAQGALQKRSLAAMAAGFEESGALSPQGLQNIQNIFRP